jgi:hypothetical protein
VNPLVRNYIKLHLLNLLYVGIIVINDLMKSTSLALPPVIDKAEVNGV